MSRLDDFLLRPLAPDQAADLLDRLLERVHRIELHGESLRRNTEGVVKKDWSPRSRPKKGVSVPRTTFGPVRIKRIGFGFRNFENYRIRALLYAGPSNWRVLGSIVVR